MSNIELHVIDLSFNFLNEILEEIKEIDGDYFLIFPNKRPLRFIQSKLSSFQQLRGNFFSMREFVEYVILNYMEDPPDFLGSVEKIFFTLNLLNELSDLNGFAASLITNPRGDYDDFKKISWGSRLISLLSDIDMQLDGKVKDLPYLSDIVPKKAVKLLENLNSVYRKYLEKLEKENVSFGGNSYKRCVKILEDEKFIEENRGATFLFCGFSILTKREREIIENIGKGFKTKLFFQVDLEGRHPHFNPYEIYDRWLDGSYWKSEKIFKKRGGKVTKSKIHFYEAYNFHSEIESVRHLISNLKEKISDLENPERIGIIIPDSKALIPLFMSIPENLPKNITIGYKLSLTPYGTFFKALLKCAIELKNRKKISSKLLLKLLNSEIFPHLNLIKNKLLSEIKGYIFENNLNFISLNSFGDGALSEGIREIFSFLLYPFLNVKNIGDFGKILEGILLKVDSGDSDFYTFLKNYLQNEVISRFMSVHENYRDLNFNLKLLSLLFENLLEEISIPFEGNPLRGIQIMGALEARGLNFENLILLDVNEGILPPSQKVDPLLPEFLKMSLKLSNYKEREKLVKYNFFRMIDSAKNVHIFYQSGESSEDKKVRSRFVEELILEGELSGKVSIKRMGINITPVVKDKNFILKDDRIKDKILNLLSNGKISATLLNTYLNCPYSFYLKYIKNIKEQAKIVSLPTADKLGTLVHYLLEKCFSDYKGKKITTDILKVVKKKIISEAESFIYHGNFKGIETEDELKDIFKHFSSLSDLKREMFLTVLIERMETLFKEFQRDVWKNIEILDLEKNFETKFLGFKLYGKIDRIDKYMEEGKTFYRIIDYKTGGGIRKLRKTKIGDFLKELEKNCENYHDNLLKRAGDILGSIQLPLYIFLFESGVSEEREIEAFYYMLGKGSGEKYISFKFDENFSLKDFKVVLKYILHHIKFSDKIFAFPEKHCEFCPYNYFCKFFI